MDEKALYVRCRVSRGDFDTEFYVVVNQSSAFVSRESVKLDHPPQGNREVDGHVLAQLIAATKDKALVQLPSETVVRGLRTWVDKSALVVDTDTAHDCG